MKKKQIKLSEEGLRNFISYSVTRLLQEGFPGREIMVNGELDGYEGSNYGSADIEIPFMEWIDSYESEKDLVSIVNYVNKKNNGKFSQLLSNIQHPADLVELIYSFYEDYDIGDNDFTLCIDYSYTQGMKGDGYYQPDDPDEFSIDRIELKQPETNQLLQRFSDPTKKALMEAILSEWPKWVDEDYIFDNYVDRSLFEGRNMGIATHFVTGSSYKPEKKEKEVEKPEKETSYRTNRGASAHFVTKKPEKPVEDFESDENMTDMTWDEFRDMKNRENFENMTLTGEEEPEDKKISLGMEELREMIAKTIKRILK